MKLRFKVPLIPQFYLAGASVDALYLESKFKHNGLDVEFNFEGEKPVAIDSMPEEIRYSRRVFKINFFIEEIKNFKGEESKYPILLKTLTSIVNRVFLNIRNFGVVTQVREMRPEDKDAKYYIEGWEVEISGNGRNWIRIVPGESWVALLTVGRTENIGQLNAPSWPDIKEAIQDNLVSPPEQEFLTNALEHLGNRNYRLALLESVICLEIVLSQYLKNYLSVYTKISSTRIDNFLSPQLGLTARLSALLNLTLHQDDIKNVEVNKVIKAVKWRNWITHRTGHLPENLEEGKVKENIFSILHLASLLARRRDQIKASPEMQEIGKSLSEQFGIPLPTIWVLRSHRILVEFVFFDIPKGLPDDEILESVAQEISTKLSSRDRRFRANEHLYIRYKVFPNDLRVRWSNGQIHHVETTLQ